MKDKPNAAEFFLHTPAESSSRYVEWAERLHSDPGVTFGCALDTRIIPLHPGDLMAVVARPGHGKSSFMAYMAKRVAGQILERGTQDKECVVYVSWEQPAEELEAFFQSGKDYSSTDLAWGRVDLDMVRRGAIQRVKLPVWMVGYSIKDSGKSKPPMTVEMVYDALRALRFEFGLTPILACLDYLQIIPIPRTAERTQQVGEAVIQAKHLAMDIGCPIVAGVQARRDVDRYANPIPTMSDAQHSSAIEQTADKQIALWRPIRTEDTDKVDTVTVAGAEYNITEELLVVKLLKQRFDTGSGIWAVHFEPQTLTVRDFTREPLDYIGSSNGHGGGDVRPVGA